MKRETVKDLLNLRDKTLKDIGFEGLLKHRDVAKYYANGGDVEFCHNDGYTPTDDPFFGLHQEYRKAIPEITVFGVKVRANPPETKPLERREYYYYLNMEEETMYTSQSWDGDSIDNTLLANKVVWKNESDIKAVVKALKGEK